MITILIIAEILLLIITALLTIIAITSIGTMNNVDRLRNCLQDIDVSISDLKQPLADISVKTETGK